MEDRMARANRIREIWAEGKAVINSWCGIPSSWSAEVMAHMGWDSLVVDMQHGLIDYQTMVTMLQGISTSNTTPLVRVPWNDPAHIQKAKAEFDQKRGPNFVYKTRLADRKPALDYRK
jgi:4-hydroxy-2-oxoheptanedioate aldolase